MLANIRAMSSPVDEPTNAAAGSGAQRQVTIVRRLMYTHSIAGLVGGLLLVLAAGAASQTEEGRRAADKAAENADALDGVASLLGLLAFAALIAFFFLAPALKKLRPGARQLTVVLAGYLIASGLIAVAAEPSAVGVIFGVGFAALDAVMIYYLTRPELVAAFRGPRVDAGGSGRLDPRTLPRL